MRENDLHSLFLTQFLLLIYSRLRKFHLSYTISRYVITKHEVKKRIFHQYTFFPSLITLPTFSNRMIWKTFAQIYSHLKTFSFSDIVEFHSKRQIYFDNLPLFWLRVGQRKGGKVELPYIKRTFKCKLLLNFLLYIFSPKRREKKYEESRNEIFNPWIIHLLRSSIFPFYVKNFNFNVR